MAPGLALMTGGTGVERTLAQTVRDSGRVPLSWSGATIGQKRIGLGAALNPIIVSWLSGRPVRRVAFNSPSPRLVAGGTVGQNVTGGDAWFWGTGCAPYISEGGRRKLFRAEESVARRVRATRGPISGGLLGGGALRSLIFGDPLTLAPQLHPRTIAPAWELGVVPHPSDLTGFLEEGGLRAGLTRYEIPPEMAGEVRLIDPAAPVNQAGLRARLDEFLSCRRILTASPTMLILAESYGIPCLYFPALGGAGPGRAHPALDRRIDVEVQDFTLGLGREVLEYYDQPRERRTDWKGAIAAIDASWVPIEGDIRQLLNAFPIDLAPLTAPEGGAVWDHPVLAGLELAHDPAAMRRDEAREAAADNAAGMARKAAVQVRLRRWRVPATAAPITAQPPHVRLMSEGATPLSWAAGADAAGAVNIGDAFSPLIVAAITGRPVRHLAFDSQHERMAAVGTIGHGQKNGVVHFWGSGLDENARWNGVYETPDDTLLQVHAMRGPMSAGALRIRGVMAPEIYGDPVYFLPRILPLPEVEKTHDLGVILHLSELDHGMGVEPPHGATRARPEHLRYQIPAAYRDRVRLIDTRAVLSEEGFRAKIAEIAACRAILSTSLHGLVIADAYNVPNAWFAFNDHGLHLIDPLNPADRIDHRIRDLYAGHGESRAQVYGARRDQLCDWDAAIGVMLSEIALREVDTRPLFDAFPGSVAVGFGDACWPIPPGALEVAV